jgi:outer membrane protein assembly factor BamB
MGHSMSTTRFSCLLVCCLVAAGAFSVRAEENWPRFRGPLGTGHSTETALPVKWDAKSIRWKVAIPGKGQSSPVNWGNKLFLTSGSDDGRLRQVFAIDTATGNLLWTAKVPVSQPETPHQMNSFATATCATDGEVVVAFFGPGGLHAWDLAGKPLWSRTDLGGFPGDWGVGASPIIDGDLVIQNCDAEGPSHLLAVHRKTGETVWSTPRQDSPKGGWSTPLVIEAGGRRELVLNGEFGLNGYDPATGKELWFCEAFNGRGEPVPEYAKGLLYVVSGKPGDTYVVKPGGSGNVTQTHRLRSSKRQGGRDLASPVVVGDVLFVTSMSGIALCYDANTGEVLGDPTRLEAAISASPLVANGLIYLQAENGDVMVVRAGKTLEIVARNSVGAGPEEVFRASPGSIGGALYLRSTTALYRIGG